MPRFVTCPYCKDTYNMTRVLNLHMHGEKNWTKCRKCSGVFSYVSGNKLEELEPSQIERISIWKRMQMFCLNVVRTKSNRS